MIYLFNGLEPVNKTWAITDISAKVYSNYPGVGPCVKLTWTNPTPASPGFSRVLIVRCTKGYSLSPEDPRNFTVYTGTAEECFDQNINPLEVYYYTFYGIDDSLAGTDDPDKYLWAWDESANSWGPGDTPPVAGYDSPLEADWGPYASPWADTRVPAIAGAGGYWRGVDNAIGWLTPGTPSPTGYWSWDYTTNLYVISKKPYGYLELIYGEAE